MHFFNSARRYATDDGRESVSLGVFIFLSPRCVDGLFYHNI